MDLQQYFVDAFVTEEFTGNPAAVCVMDCWPEVSFMNERARINNLSETAFIVKESDGYHLRWFTPTTEVGLCGHATLASGFVILSLYEKEADSVTFHINEGEVSVIRKDNGFFELAFPNIPTSQIDVTNDMERVFGQRPLEAWLGLDLECVFEDEDIIYRMNPDDESLSTLPGRLQNVTARCNDGVHDCISRTFGPKLGIHEDPVCGSAHCQIAPLWSSKLSKSSILAVQASDRGGLLHCQIIDENNLRIAGKCRFE